MARAFPSVPAGKPVRTYAGAAVAAGVVVLVVVLRFGGAIKPEFPGLPTAGPFTEWGLPLARFCFDACALGCVGTLTAALLAPASSPESRSCRRAAGWWALGWALATALSYVLTLSNLIPLPAGDLLASPDLLEFGTSIPQTQALLVVLAATAVAGLTWRLPPAVRLAVAVFGLLPPAYVGHAASAGDHDIAVSALMAHLVSVSVWVGGLVAVLVHFRRSQELPAVLPRFSALALCCFAAVAVSGVASAWVRLSAPSDLWQSAYGQLLLAKTAALVLLGLFGWTHRRRTVAGIADRSVRRTFVRLATGEVIVMAAAVGLAIGLSRTPPPPGGGGGHGQSALEYALAPVTPGALITEVRLDPTVLILLMLPAVAYAVHARRAASWPAGRAIVWYAGLALTALVLLGGVGSYARAMLSVHSVQHAVLTVVAPLLLCLGAPFTVAGRYRFLAHPAVYFGAFVLLYGTPWLSWSLSGYAPHLLTELLFFGLGLLVFGVLTGADPGTSGDRARLLAAVTLTHLAVGTYLLLAPPVAAGWISLAAPSGAPGVLADQRLAGAVAMLLPLPALVLPAVRAAGRGTAVLVRGGR
ncbi:cytochrome c oxidase assembly protein [Nonomuraea jabiensis]|uniref:Putative copper resistance protein D n=1 Tax=Nonomuraea jabiensis TaxID=882448 RepID=A0A7W9G494_9ACTN|nr:cytochrome c oxidase assembly protein [Nonomuraea jabiensis]MBB5776872.1 putative copper resistance protein D [Nonomuraea jabiensis]